MTNKSIKFRNSFLNFSRFSFSAFNIIIIMRGDTMTMKLNLLIKVLIRARDVDWDVDWMVKRDVDLCLTDVD